MEMLKALKEIILADHKELKEQELKKKDPKWLKTHVPRPYDFDPGQRTNEEKAADREAFWRKAQAVQKEFEKSLVFTVGVYKKPEPLPPAATVPVPILVRIPDPAPVSVAVPKKPKAPRKSIAAKRVTLEYARRQRDCIAENSELEKVLREASEHIPKYLFRMWTSGSGGNSKLNSKTTIKPHAFHYSRGHASVFEMSGEYFVKIVDSHLGSSCTPLTQFSSWSSSLQFALNYASEAGNSPHISVIDTEMLKGTNTIIYVPSITAILNNVHPNQRHSYKMYHMEYLAHGVIKGEAHTAVSYISLVNNGLVSLWPRSHEIDNSWADMGRFHRDIVPINKQHLRQTSKIAGLFGPNFYYPIAIAIICLTRRSRDFWKRIKREEVLLIVETLGRKTIPDWSASAGVLTNHYPDKYDDNKQMFHLMSALLKFGYAKTAEIQVRRSTKVEDTCEVSVCSIR